MRAVLDVVLEVDVARARSPSSSAIVGEREVVRRDEADGAARDEAAHDGFGADAAVVGVGAVQDLVEQEEERAARRRSVDELPQPRDLRVEARRALGQRVERCGCEAPSASGESRSRVARTGAPG